MNTETLQKADEALDRAAKQKRKRRLLILAAIVAKIGTGYAAYDHYYASNFISTDNAYTAAETAQVTPAIGGIVREVRVSDTSYVHQGDVLVVLDDVDARLALAQAEAELGRAQRRVRGYVANDASLAAQLAARASDEKRAQADLDRASIDLRRRENLADSGSVSGDELTKARNAYESAQAALAQARSNYTAAIGARDANAALIEDTTEDSNPEVALARARRDQARVNLERTVIRAPVDGVVAKRSVQVGQQIQAGSPVLAIVPVAEVHVDANFKEGQLERVRIGQPVEVTSDLYGSSVTYRGVVVGLSGGTGSTFAAIPAQNATGNWIKVVQRVPVRIKLDPKELEAKPLQIGLSMEATIDTREG
ncbi:MAG TPA: HlyD family efflux transporter periplasmic adaptor subunit [Steroidobacteraceae bacterium]|nr:HlyD family efflux transporter periplasmic adaptor subunit [Steroidobacteraceae bacterium]